MANKYLCVGINNYPGAELRGPVNDANNVYAAIGSLRLRQGMNFYWYFPRGSGSKLLDSAGSKANIIAKWTALIQQAQPGNCILIFEAGHGVRLADTNGDEPDGYDEGGVSQDMQFLSDDERAALLAQAQPGVTIDIVLDHCFSGGSTSPRLMGKPCKKRFLSEADYYAHGGQRPAKQPISAKLLQVITEGNHCLWAASSPGGYSAEMVIDGVWQGVFSYWFRQSMLNNRGFTRAQHMAYICQHVEPEGQFPQMECTQAVADTVPFPSI